MKSPDFVNQGVCLNLMRLDFAGTDAIMRTVKYFVLAGLAALVTGIVTISLHFYGAHDMQGFFAVVAGYPGLLANGDYTRLNETLFAVVNWLFYFLFFEGAVALKRKFSRGTEQQGNTAHR